MLPVHVQHKLARHLRQAKHPPELLWPREAGALHLVQGSLLRNDEVVLLQQLQRCRAIRVRLDELARVWRRQVQLLAVGQELLLCFELHLADLLRFAAP